MTVFGTHDQATLDQLRQVKQNAVYVALMADGHVGYVMPIGGVAAYDNKVSVVGVGFDIACGNAAIKTDRPTWPTGPFAGDPRRYYEELADEIANTISFGLGRANQADDAPVDDPLFDDPTWDLIPIEHREALRQKARSQLGTVGSGNHYVDVFFDDGNRLWVGVHFGSRGLGHTIASNFLALGQGKQWGERVPEAEVLLDLDTELGQQYWALMELAGRYAYVGREWVARKVVSLLGAEETDLVHNHHNFAWRESHFGRELIVVRKGATPAFPNQRGFIGGSMGDDAVIVRGAAPRGEGDPHATFSDEGVRITQEHALYSTVHGAGRVMSRSQAKGSRAKFNKATGETVQKRKGQITRQMMSEWTREKGVIVRGGDVDEAPQVYRRLTDVLAAQGPTIEIETVLHPLIVVMASDSVRDPYKD
ncbi:RtcB family protein [Nitrolancea hollandica]|uniref:3'-phosphate/5'-hydroxy nucleic acid ligase n=1 Tax=Nitrolancea hollandica Lb TaxID=1129897 RepID=I4EL00_9BACT|nr:RtcB family protein [Nitrolancea hollandica]CCF85362.1 conserved hypothetical protein [Nitrolancea hollandica Lb]